MISARGKSARYAREVSFARPHDEAGYTTLYAVVLWAIRQGRDGLLLQQVKSVANS